MRLKITNLKWRANKKKISKYPINNKGKQTINTHVAVLPKLRKKYKIKRKTTNSKQNIKEKKRILK